VTPVTNPQRTRHDQLHKGETVPLNLRRGPMTSNSKSLQKPEPTKNALSEHELAKVAGGFNPQPDPPGVVAKPTQPAQFWIRSFGIFGI